ncbi:MAG: flavodoxin-dependent (E)-4-hydroxy-3-methylbut-2-enyl-diphosphate synthase [Candidatus Cloacimonetes bacterium]|nr:flavodoxin-dependent (E)-4-hydroxy-3-methylbut-2-enyl-diphosphate synthase [Candidatus Cloacimonadota bacterium]
MTKQYSINRRETRQIHIGNIAVGGGSPITIQSMTNTRTLDETRKQIRALVAAGCDIVRLAVPDTDTVAWIAPLEAEFSIPLIADIHFNYKLALAAIEAGIDGLRLNPGNIGGKQKVREVVAAAKERQLPIRIGVNAGSLGKEILNNYGVSPEAMVESALEHVRILEELNYPEMKISVKASSVSMTISAYRLLAKKVNYPLHLGVTEAGTVYSGTVKSAVGIGTLLAEGIGDTIRVSLCGDPVREIYAAQLILQSLGLRKGLEIIACPTCGRTVINVEALAEELEQRLKHLRHLPLQIAVMGCIVNGPGEAREADYGITGGNGEGLIFHKGEIVAKVKEAELINRLIQLITENQ